MRKLILAMTTACFFISAANAQNVKGIVKDQQGKGLEKSTVSLLRAKDSSVVKLAVTGDDGRYSIATVPGKYLVSSTHVGYARTFSAPFEVSGSGDTNVPEVAMTKAAGNLQGVTVTSARPIVEVKADKMILNVEGTINSTGQDALELLRKAPGVMVDKDDNITVAGKNGVQVYIDGKPSPLSGTDLASYLKSLQAQQIESIEIITNPSAKFEAAGNAGIINIRLKKNKAFGTNGSVNAGYNIGSLPKYNAGFALNHRNQHVNIFGNYNYNNSDNYSWFTLQRIQFDTMFLQNQKINSHNKSHGFKAGLDYFLNKKSTIGVMVNGNLSDNNTNTSGPMYFYSPANTDNVVKTLQASNTNDANRDNVNANLNYRYSVSGGTELNIDADYGYYNLRSEQYQPNYYYDANGNETSRVINKMISPTDIDLASVKADYERNFKGGRLGIGGKVGFVKTDNDFQRYNVIGSSDIKDIGKSNRFKYDENINALYVNYNKAYKGFMFQFGLRTENTHLKGVSTGQKNVNGSWLPYDSTFERDYTDFFPSAALTFNKNPMKQWGITFSRRIDRPAYQDLNPFEFKLNEYTFMKGNTELRPQYTNSVGVSYTYKYKLNMALNYSHVKDVFAQIPDTINKTQAFLTKKNLATQDIVSLNVSYPFQYKWYSFFANLNTYYSHYIADFGGGDRNIDQGVFAATYYMQNSFKLGKGWTGELSGFYSSPSLWQGVFKAKAIYGIDGGFQKTLFKGKATARAIVSDIFKTMKWQGSTNFVGAQSTASGHWESRQLKLAFAYRFGSNTVKAARQRGTGIDEENKRTNSSGGQGGIGQ